MKNRLPIMAIVALLFTALPTKAQISVLQDYTNYNSATIGTFQGILFKEAGFSGLFPIPGTNGKEFWTTSDRGVNVDAANANPSGCRPVYDKIYAFPKYAPKIHRIRIDGDSIQILKTITIKRPDGSNASGLLNPDGWGSTSTELVLTDTVLDCSRIGLKTYTKDVWGIDAEGIVVDKNGNFWLCEENGPTIWKLNSNGVVLARYTPYAKQSGAQSQDIYIDSVFKYRKNNRGFEGITIAPNGKVYAMIQSPILYPTKSIGEASRVHRLLEIDPVTGAMKMYAYLNDGIIGASGSNQIRLRDWKLGDLAAINDSTFLVIEAAARGTSDYKKLYQINISGATAVHSGLYGGKTLEALVDSTGLQANGIVPVKKTLFFNLLANGWPSAYDKAEGVAIVNDSTLAICNDNDYGSSSPSENGISTATNLKSHLVTFRLKGTNKFKNYKTFTTQYNKGTTGISSSNSPYLTPVLPGVKFTSVLTTKDIVGNYKMSGIPDGLGAFDNNDGTFTLVMNHELGNTVGVTRAHGSIGAFVSKWVIDKSTLEVKSGEDLIKNVYLWSNGSYTLYNSGNPSSKAAFSRFCSADLAPLSALYNSKTSLGTRERIFMNGEESGNEGRAFGHIVTGTAAGTTYELPALGKFSWENAVACPNENDKTVVAGTDDIAGGQVYIYIGQKKNTGTDIEKAGLTGGKLYGIAVTGLSAEVSTGIPADNTKFTLVDLGDVKDSTGNGLNTKSVNAGITGFLRPEDGAWDPKNPADFYFNTTNAFTAPSRLWRLRFTDINNPELGGTISALLDGTEGQKMLDNMTIDNYGHVILQEDPGNQDYVAKVWQYTIATDQLTVLAQHDTTRFVSKGSQFLTVDEESSGVLDMEAILGTGYSLLTVQPHYSLGGEFVEGGQLLMMYNPTVKNKLAGASPYSSETPYLKPFMPGAKFTAMLTVGDAVGGYKMVGIPDGLGAFDNGNGTFTLVMNHELNSTSGVTRAHGSIGSFVSKWVINKSDLSMVSGGDLIKRAFLWNPLTSSYVAFNGGYPSATAAFGRFCSGDLPAATAFYNAKTGLGTTERIYMNGEENGLEGRAVAHIVTGTNAGTSYELPYLGKFSWENAVASPYAADKTVVGGMDDGTGGQVYFYIGTKTSSGIEIEKAGLSNGNLYGVQVEGLSAEVSGSIPAANTKFKLIDLGKVNSISGATLNTNSVNAGVTSFLRPEDGSWDPKNPNDFYFNTTNAFNAPSRLWRLRFTDIANPEQGGTITAVLDGTEGQNMLDNMAIDNYGHIMLQEDVGNQAHIGKLWHYDTEKDTLIKLAYHDSSRFLAGMENYLTQDEESSGMIDAQEILGAGMFLTVVQAHYANTTELVEGGQLLALYNPLSAKANPEVGVTGNAVNIVNGDVTPSTGDNTDFGSVNVTTPVTKTFTITNSGTGTLKIQNISLAGTNASEFAITNNPAFPATLNTGASWSVTVKFNSTTPGIKNATLNIANNDFDEGNYTFALAGTALACDINVKGNTLAIATGDTTPSLDDNSDFGYLFLGEQKINKFTIENKGNASLIINSIQIGGVNATEFNLLGNLNYPFSVAAGTSQNIELQFIPQSSGIRTATVNINSNDYDEKAYSFKVRGLAVSTLSLKNSFISTLKLAPNPTNTKALLFFSLPQPQNVEVQLLNSLGQVIKTIANGKNRSGDQSFEINTADVPNGIYFVQISNGKSQEVFKLVVNH